MINLSIVINSLHFKRLHISELQNVHLIEVNTQFSTDNNVCKKVSLIQFFRVKRFREFSERVSDNEYHLLELNRF